MNLRGKSYPSTVVWWYLFGKCWANDNVDIINSRIFSSDFRGRATTSRALERTPSRWCWFHTSSWFWLMDTMQSLQAAMLEMNARQLPVSQIRPLAPPFYPRGKLGTPMLAFGFSLHASSRLADRWYARCARDGNTARMQTEQQHSTYQISLRLLQSYRVGQQNQPDCLR